MRPVLEVPSGFVIIALDRPLCGDMGIKAGSYQLVYDHYMK